MNKEENREASYVPLPLAVAMAQNPAAMAYFSSLSQEEQKEIVRRTDCLHSSSEFAAFVGSLTSPYPSDYNDRPHQ